MRAIATLVLNVLRNSNRWSLTIFANAVGTNPDYQQIIDEMIVGSTDLQQYGCHVLDCEFPCYEANLMCKVHTDEWHHYRRNCVRDSEVAMAWREWLGSRPTTVCSGCDQPMRLDSDYLCRQCRHASLDA